MTNLNQLFRNPADQRKGGNCGVTALAVSAGISFQKAWDTFIAVNPRQYGHKRWTGGTYTVDQATALKRLKIAFYNLPIEKTNLKNFVRDYTQRDVVYMVTTGRHVQTVLNGHVIDQQGKKHIAEYWGRKKFVQNVRVIKEPFKYADNAGNDTAPMPARPSGHTSNARQLLLF